MSAFGLGEPPARRDTLALRPGRILRNYRTIARNDRFVAYVTCIVCVYIAVFAFIASSPVVFIQHLGLTPDRMGLYLAAVMCSQLIPNFLAGRLAGRFGLQRMVQGGVIAAGIAGVAMFAVVWSGHASVL